MRLKGLGLVLMAAAALLLNGCSGGEGVREDAAPVEERVVGAEQPMSEEDMAAQSAGAETDGTFEGREIVELLSDPASPLSRRVFYFDFNSAELSEEDRTALETHVRFLNKKRKVSVVLEGHADERGSREYNLALGERRAKVIERVLSLQGVNGDQIQVISFGEERPAAIDHNDEAWRLNRRVELFYSGY